MFITPYVEFPTVSSGSVFAHSRLHRRDAGNNAAYGKKITHGSNGNFLWQNGVYVAACKRAVHDTNLLMQTTVMAVVST